MSDYLAKAIKKLRPNAEFTFKEDDYSTIDWIVLDGKAPTKAEIETTIEQVKESELADVEAKKQAKATAQAKLSALGLTVEDLTALGL
jgi:hypothetical protein